MRHPADCSPRDRRPQNGGGLQQGRVRERGAPVVHTATACKPAAGLILPIPFHTLELTCQGDQRVENLQGKVADGRRAHEVRGMHAVSWGMCPQAVQHAEPPKPNAKLLSSCIQIEHASHLVVAIHMRQRVRALGSIHQRLRGRQIAAGAWVSDRMRGAVHFHFGFTVCGAASVLPPARSGRRQA